VAVILFDDREDAHLSRLDSRPDVAATLFSEGAPLATPLK
jgi:hypothetical protein